MNNTRIKKLFKGQLPKKEFMALYIPAVFLLVVSWAFARTVFIQSAGYEIESNFISNQGNLTNNPIGAWFFIFSTAYMGAILFFYFIFLYQQLKPNNKVLSELMMLAGAMGGIGLIGVGIFPENLNDTINAIHNTSAVTAFSGLGLGALLSLIIMGIKAYKRHDWPDPSYLGILVIVVSFFVMMLIPTSESTIRQWTGFYIIFIWANFTILILPNDKAVQENNPV